MSLAQVLLILSPLEPWRGLGTGTGGVQGTEAALFPSQLGINNSIPGHFLPQVWVSASQPLKRFRPGLGGHSSGPSPGRAPGSSHLGLAMLKVFQGQGLTH